MTTITTTLSAIRAHSPCAAGWKKLLASLGKSRADDAQLAFEHILESNGLDDAIWACRAVPKYSDRYRLFAAACACRTLHLADDPRITYAVETAVLRAYGEATEEELYAAWAAGVAAWAARDAAWDAARDVAWADAWDAEREWQAEEFRKMCRGEGPYGEV